VNDETRGLVDDEDVVVLVDDVEADLGRGLQVGFLRRRDVEGELRPGLDDRVRSQGFAAGGEPPSGDELLDVAPGQAREIGDEAVHAGRPPGRDDEPADPRGRLSHPEKPAGGSVARSGSARC
jgi:hypothetical protein